MKKFPFFASINLGMHSSGGREGNVGLIRNVILQSSNFFKFGGWNKANLINSLSRSDSSACFVLCASVSFYSDEVYVHLDSGEKLTLKDLVCSATSKHFNACVLFLYCGEFEVDKIRSRLGGADFERCSVYVSCKDSKKFLYALACELVNWWGLASSVKHEVTFEHFLSCARNCVANYQDSVSCQEFCCDFLPPSSDLCEIAWSGGANYCIHTDIDKIMNRAREEQLGDTIKRVFDSACSLRDEHLSVQERLVSSQGLFWLSEVEVLNDVKNWILLTRLYSDISMEAKLNEPKRARVIQPSQHVTIDHIYSMLNKFVSVTPGVYSFGSNDTILDSEPPANNFEGLVEEFKILKQPITEEMWHTFVLDSRALHQPHWPLVNVNYFEVLDFIEILNSVFNEFVPDLFSGLRVNLPSEYQWEAAARGLTSKNYPWGDDFDGRACNFGMLIKHPTNVGQFSPFGDSPFGCQDMAGNVREWTRSYGGTRGVDWQVHSIKTLMSDSPIILPSSRMIVKGGSYSYSSECVQSWVRNTQIASRKDAQTGFRIVIEKINNA